MGIMLVQMYMTSNSGKHPLPQNISSVSWLHLYLAVLCSVAYEDDCFEAPFSCWDPLPHLQYCRSAVRSRLMSGRKSLNPLYRLSEHIACHLCAIFPHGQCLAVPDSHPAPANHRTCPWVARLSCKRLMGWMCGIGHQPDVWVAPDSLHR